MSGEHSYGRDEKIDATIAKHQVIAHEPDRGPEPRRGVDTAARVGLMVVGTLAGFAFLEHGLAFIHDCQVEDIVATAVAGAHLNLQQCAIEQFSWLKYLPDMLKK